MNDPRYQFCPDCSTTKPTTEFYHRSRPYADRTMRRCNGERRSWALAIDHINGVTDPSLPRAGESLWRRLRDMGWPKDEFRLLCHLCNMAKGHYGACPHERERAEDAWQESW